VLVLLYPEKVGLFMKKKNLYAFFILLLLVGAFLAGSWFNNRETKSDRLIVKPPEVNAAERPETDTSNFPPGTIRVSPEKQQLIGVRVATVEKLPRSSTLRTLGRVAPDETRIYRINAATDGWVKKMLPVTTDSLVRKDELLATFYAPEFSSAMKAYLYGLRSLDRFQKSGKETKEQLESTDASIENYRNSLRNLGMGDHQLDEIMRTRQGGDHVEIRAPEAGFILLRNLTLGERFQRGTELYRIADLSKVWIVVSTYETEASSFKPGMPVRVSAANLKKTFPARVSHVPPRFDSGSRTLQVRLEADNPELLLRPDMFVDVQVSIPLPPAITAPLDAILDSGLKKTVFVDRGNGLFEPREVETGWRMGNWVEIIRGLKAGEQILISGNFLIDSESKLEMAASGMQPTLKIDPVCGMEISLRKAEKEGLKSTYLGESYYFCSQPCREQFEKTPNRFTKKTPAETSVEKVPPSEPSQRTEGHDHS
jgi:membrane fusion protein, copper/silver efflux system